MMWRRKEVVAVEKQTKIPHIEIKIDGVDTKILIDGKELEGVRSFGLVQDSKIPVPILHINLLAMDLSINAKTLPALPEPYQSLYVPKIKLIEKGIVTEEILKALL